LRDPHSGIRASPDSVQPARRSLRATGRRRRCRRRTTA